MKEVRVQLKAFFPAVLLCCTHDVPLHCPAERQINNSFESNQHLLRYCSKMCHCRFPLTLHFRLKKSRNWHDDLHHGRHIQCVMCVCYQSNTRHLSKMMNFHVSSFFNAETVIKWGGKYSHLSVGYFLRNMSANNIVLKSNKVY